MSSSNGAGGDQSVAPPQPPLPPDVPLKTRLLRRVFYGVIVLLGWPLLACLFVVKWRTLRETLRKASRGSIKETREYHDAALLARIWGAAVGRLYAPAVEYQAQEGMCCPATQRCMLKSLPMFKAQDLPAPRAGPVTIQRFAAGLDAASHGRTRTSTVLGTEGFEAFMAAIRRTNDPRFRVAANFLRSPLFGFNQPCFLIFFGGHFSPLLGYLEQEHLVAVFDVNHRFGAFLVSPERLFDAVATFDISSGKSRGLVVSEVCSVT